MSDNTSGNTSQSRPEASVPRVSGVSAGRRRVLGGMVGAPIVVLAARPALAAQCTFSGGQSAFFASHYPVNSCAAGFSPGYWMENPDEWPSGYAPGSPITKPQGTWAYKGGTSFHEAFGTDPININAKCKLPGENNKTPISLMNAMRLNTGSPEFHWVAALLSSASVDGYPYKPGDIVRLYSNPHSAGENASFDAMTAFLTALEK